MIVFKCKYNEGYVVKILIEILSHNVKTGCFEISSSGVSLCTTDSNKRALVSAQLNASTVCYKFAPTPSLRYFDPSTGKIYVGITLSHFHKILSPLKKKDSLELFIDDEAPMELQIRIIPKESLNNHVSTASVTIQSIRELLTEVPPESLYSHYTVVPSADFQKMVKNMLKINSTIEVKARGTQMEFGCFQEGIGRKYDRYGEDPEDEDFTEFKAEYSSELFSRITKLSGLCSDIQVYAGRPLKIKAPIGIRSIIGNIEFYLKSTTEIEEDRRALEDFEYEDD